MRYLFGFICVLALAVMGCSEPPGGQDKWAPLDYESNPHSARYDFSAVDSAADSFVASFPAVRGLTLAVVRKGEGQLYEKGYPPEVPKDLDTAVFWYTAAATKNFERSYQRLVALDRLPDHLIRSAAGGD